MIERRREIGGGHAGRQHQRVPGVPARQRGRDVETVRQFRRHVLRAVNGKIDGTVQKRVLDLFHEEPLGPRLGERTFLEAVAARLDDDELDARAGALEELSHGPRLPEGKGAAARPELEDAVHLVPAFDVSGARPPVWVRSSAARPKSRLSASA